MRKNLTAIADGIWSDEEFRDTNIEDVNMIISYAEAMGMEITEGDASRIQSALKDYREHVHEGLSINWFTYVEQPLEGETK